MGRGSELKFTLCLLSPPQRLLLVNNSERENGSEGEKNGSAGNDEKRESGSQCQRSPHSLIFPSSQPPRVFSQA